VKCKLEIWLIYRRIGTYIVPDIWEPVIPEPFHMSREFVEVFKS
jgi:hypothetical protein